MKAGCSIVEKPEGGGGEQKLISHFLMYLECPSVVPFLFIWAWFTNARL